jgi:phosphopantetheinyl transferase (holo-ACP synthase)
MSVILYDRSDRSVAPPTTAGTVDGDGMKGRGQPRPACATVCRTHVQLDPSADVDELAHSYLDESEQEAFSAMVGRARIPWLLGRVAAKDAVRDHLTSRAFAEVDPTRIIVRNDGDGRPNVEVRGARFATRGVQVSIAHKQWIGVAVAARVRQPATPRGRASDPAPPAPNGVGIDIESVETRPASFETSILSPSERSLLRDDQVDRRGPSDRVDRDTWLTRMWAVKEATAKATGLGLRGRPKDFEVDSIDDDRLRCCGRWIATAPLLTGGARYMIAWTDSV